MVELERVGGTGLRICNLRLGNVVVYKYQKTIYLIWKGNKIVYVVLFTAGLA